MVEVRRGKAARIDGNASETHETTRPPRGSGTSTMMTMVMMMLMMMTTTAEGLWGHFGAWGSTVLESTGAQYSSRRQCARVTFCAQVHSTALTTMFLRTRLVCPCGSFVFLGGFRWPSWWPPAARCPRNRFDAQDESSVAPPPPPIPPISMGV